MAEIYGVGSTRSSAGHGADSFNKFDYMTTFLAPLWASPAPPALPTRQRFIDYTRGCSVHPASGPQHRLNFLPDPHGQGEFRPTLPGLRSGAGRDWSRSTPTAANTGARLASGRSLMGERRGGGGDSVAPADGADSGGEGSATTGIVAASAAGAGASSQGEACADVFGADRPLADRGAALDQKLAQ